MKMQQNIEDYLDLIDLGNAKAETVNKPSIPYNEIADKINQTTKKFKSNKQLKIYL